MLPDAPVEPGHPAGTVQDPLPAERAAALRDQVAVIGVGDTDYARDHARVRAGHRDRDSYGCAVVALRAALADAGLSLADVDGMVVGPPLAIERTGEIIGLDCAWSVQADAVNAVILATLAICAGLAETVALIYGNDQRTAATAYGGPDAMGADIALAYVQYAPWGMTSQGALYAMMAQRAIEAGAFTADDLGRVVAGQRAFAALNPRAVMREPVDLTTYRASPFVCEPLRRLDYCLVNDGGVAMILTTAARARRSGRRHVLVRGFGRADLHREATGLRPRLIDFYRPAQRAAGARAFAMAGLGPEAVDVLQVYDSFSPHIPFALEGFGFCGEGESPRLIRDGALGPGGSLPTNTSGGMLSESYMQGWNHQAEAVRQLRGEAGARQVPGAVHAMFVSDVAGKAAGLIYRAGGA